MKTSNKYLTNLVFSVRYGPQTRLVRGIYFRSRCIRANVKPQTTKRLLVRENSDNIDSHQLKANSVFRSNIIWRDLINPKWPTVKSEQLFWNYILHILTGAVTEKWMICISLLKPCGDNLTHIQKYSPLLDDWESSLLDFTLETKLVSSKHLTQVHLKISSRTLQNLASHLMTKYMTWSILFDSKLSHACQNALFDCSAVKSWKMYTVTLLLKSA